MITEHEVDISIAGDPRWWTVENGRGVREVVRVAFQRGEHYEDLSEAPKEAVIFVLLPRSKYAFPPFAVAALRMGPIGWEEIEKDGGCIVLRSSTLGRKLEAMLMKTDEGDNG